RRDQTSSGHRWLAANESQRCALTTPFNHRHRRGSFRWWGQSRAFRRGHDRHRKRGGRDHRAVAHATRRLSVPSKAGRGHVCAMPADYGSIVGSGLADVKFLRHKSKSSVAATTLASEDGSIRRGYWATSRVCRTDAEKTCELATKLGMVEYIAMADTNLAWVTWRQENYAEAEKLATDALELWHGMDDPYGS